MGEQNNVTRDAWDQAGTEEANLTLRKSRFWPILQIALKILIRTFPRLILYDIASHHAVLNVVCSG